MAFDYENKREFVFRFHLFVLKVLELSKEHAWNVCYYDNRINTLCKLNIVIFSKFGLQFRPSISVKEINFNLDLYPLVIDMN